MPVVTSTEWGRFLAKFPGHHFLQTPAWGVLKADFGWQPTAVIHGEIGAQILFRALPLGFSVAYIAKGPVYDLSLGYPPAWEALWGEIDRLCRARRAVFLKVEPDLWQETTPLLDPAIPVFEKPTPVFPAAAQPPPGFSISPSTIQPLRTLVVDLSGSEDQVLGRMKQKTRYNVRLAQRRGMIVHSTQDVDLFSRLMEITGERDAFGVHAQAYYQRALDLLHCQAEILVADLDGEPLAALFAVAQGPRAYYLYGASSNTHRDAMPTYLIQWEAMRWARQQGCTEYDLWGVPDTDMETLEAGFTNRSTGLWGVYRFKRGFGGELRRGAGPWDRVYNRPLYLLYRVWAARREAE